MQRYFNSQPVKEFSFPVPVHRYDKGIVDKSHFNPHADNLADFMRSEIAKSSAGTPIYDTHDGKVTNVPTEIEIALRNNQLSRAEVSQLAREADNALKETVSKSKKLKAEKDLEAISKARQDYLDAKTGFDPAQVQVENNK